MTLSPAERIAALGAVAVAGSLLFPWYGIELELFGGFSQTGLEAFNFAHAALLLTAAAALGLIWLCARGYELPRPLGEGALLIAAGALDRGARSPTWPSTGRTRLPASTGCACATAPSWRSAVQRASCSAESVSASARSPRREVVV